MGKPLTLDDAATWAMREVSGGEHSNEMALILSYLATAYEAAKGVALRERERADRAERELAAIHEGARAERERVAKARAARAAKADLERKDPLGEPAYDPAGFPPLMTIPEAADRVGLFRDTLRTRVENADLVPVEIRKNLRYYASSQLLPLMGPSTAGGKHGHDRAPHR